MCLAPDVLGLSLQRPKSTCYSNSIQIDLRALVRDAQDEMKPLRKWARNRLSEDVDGSGIARLSPTVS